MPHQEGEAAVCPVRLPVAIGAPMVPGMFVVTEADAAAIRAAFDQGGELSAAVELRRLFPGVTDMAEARECARTIAAWKPLPLQRLRPEKRGVLGGPLAGRSGGKSGR
jgi:hypothetical protein